MKITALELLNKLKLVLMSEKKSIPNEETRKRLVSNLRKNRVELQEFGFQLEELLAQMEKEVREQKLKRLEKTKQNLLL